MRVADLTILIAAAGRGERLGLGPKAMLEIDGETLLARIAATALAVSDDVRCALPRELLADPRCAIEGLRSCAGGDSRHGSFVAQCAQPLRDYVMLLDVARPFASRALCLRVLDSARRHGAAVAFEPATVPVGLIEHGFARSAVAAAHYRLPQSPQCFRRELFEHSVRDSTLQAQTEWERVLAAGTALAVVDGERRNIKITDALDWQIAQHVIATATEYSV